MITRRPTNQTLLIGMGLAVLWVPNQSAQQQGLTPDEILQRAGAAIVVLSGTDENGKALTPGVGFVIAPGVVATSNDVVKDAVTINAKSRDREMRADIFAVNLQRTVALLKTYDYANNTKFYYSKIPALPLASSGTVAPGGRVYLVTARGLSQVSIGKAVTIRGREYPEIRFKVAEADKGSAIVNQYGEVMGLLGLTGPESKRIAYLVPASIVADADKPSKGVPDDVQGPFAGIRSGTTIKPPATGATMESPTSSERGTADQQTGKYITSKSGVAPEGFAIRRVEPSYPALAKAAKVIGSVVVEVVIDEDGYVVRSRPLSGHVLLNDSAAAAAMGWKFQRTFLDGKPVKVLGTLTFNFVM